MIKSLEWNAHIESMKRTKCGRIFAGGAFSHSAVDITLLYMSRLSALSLDSRHTSVHKSGYVVLNFWKPPKKKFHKNDEDL